MNNSHLNCMSTCTNNRSHSLIQLTWAQRCNHRSECLSFRIFYYYFFSVFLSCLPVCLYSFFVLSIAKISNGTLRYIVVHLIDSNSFRSFALLIQSAPQQKHNTLFFTFNWPELSILFYSFSPTLFFFCYKSISFSLVLFLFFAFIFSVHISICFECVRRLQCVC